MTDRNERDALVAIRDLRGADYFDGGIAAAKRIAAEALAAPAEGAQGEVDKHVAGKKFTRAWLNIAKLPGAMMEGTGGRFGPVPGTTSCVVTTSERNVEDWKQRGTGFIEVFTTPPAASVDVGCLKQIRALLQSLPAAQGREHIDLGVRLNQMIDSADGAKPIPEELANRIRNLRDKAEANTPQPAEGDGAVADVETLEQITQARFTLNDERLPSDVLDYLRDLAMRLPSTRPAATAVVPDAERRHIERAIRVLRRDYESPLADAVESIYKQSLASAPAAPKGGVVHSVRHKYEQSAEHGGCKQCGYQAHETLLHEPLTAALNPEQQP